MASDGELSREIRASEQMFPRQDKRVQSVLTNASVELMMGVVQHHRKPRTFSRALYWCSSLKSDLSTHSFLKLFLHCIRN